MNTILEHNVYAHEGDGGFFVIYAEPFQIKLIRDENLSGEKGKLSIGF